MDSQTLITAAVQIITVAAIVYWLYRRLSAPIGAVLRQRTERIETSLRVAEASQKRAVEMQQESQRQLDQARVEGQAIAVMAEKAAVSQRQALVEQAEHDAAALAQRARTTIQRERRAAVDELRREASRLAVLAAGKVVVNALDGAANRTLADRAIADLEGAREP